MSIFTQTNLVSDIAHYGKIYNPNLINGWGLLVDSDGSFWITSNNNGLLLHLDSHYEQIGSAVVPAAAGTGIGSPSGLVFNNTQGFKISGSFIGPAKIIVATQDGLIAGYNPQIDPNNAIVQVTTADAVYTGIAIANGFIYVANLSSGAIEKYDQNWSLVAVFTDNGLNDIGYSPYNIYATKDRLYVTFGRRTESGKGTVNGLGNGFIDTFDFNGVFIERVVNRGPLNSPWGMFIENNRLYVGNFGDGRINIFELPSGRFLYPVKDRNCNIIVIDGLSALVPFLDPESKKADKCHDLGIYITAAVNEIQNGLFAKLT